MRQALIINHSHRKRLVVHRNTKPALSRIHTRRRDGNSSLVAQAICAQRRTSQDSKQMRFRQKQKQ